MTKAKLTPFFLKKKGMKIIFTTAIALALIVGAADVANAANIVYSADTQVTINGNNYTISSGSEATSAIINPTTLVVVVPTGSTFTLVSPSGYLLTNVDDIAGVVAQTCASGQRTLALTGADARTVTITPDTSATCAGRRIIPTPTPEPTPTPTPTTPSAPEATPTPTPTVIPGPATPAAPSGVTLYRVAGEHRVYVIKDKKKQWIKTAEEFDAAGYKWSDVSEVTAAALAAYPDMEISSGATLYRAEGDSKVYAVKDNVKQWIKTAEEFNAAGYKWADIIVTTPAAVAAYPDTAVSSGATLYRAEGDSKVYAVKDNVKQWIKTAEEFNAAGYKWADIIVTTPAAVAAYPEGTVAIVKVKVVNTSTLRVRQSNTTQSAIVGYVKGNEIFTAQEEKAGWYKIKTSGGVIGWISGAYAAKQ